MRLANARPDMSSHGVVALTGASGFLVSEMSKALSLKGWKVALLDQNLDGVENLAHSICKRNGEAIAIQADVCAKDSYHNALEVILKKWDHLDGAVFGAGFNAPTPFLEIKLEEWNRILEVQLTGTMLGCQVFGKQMLKQGRGSIVTISSASSGPPLSKAFAYSVAKAGVKNFLAASPKLDDGGHAALQLARPLERLALWLENPAAEFFPSAADLTVARARISHLPRPLIALHPGSGGERKNWPLANWHKLLTELPTVFPDAHFLIIGGESDTDRLAVLEKSAPSEVTFLKNLPLPELGATLSQCTFFLGHDSGISHLAAASGTPSLLLFGPTDPDIWAPANSHTTTLKATDGDLSRLEVATVLAKLRELNVT